MEECASKYYMRPQIKRKQACFYDLFWNIFSFSSQKFFFFFFSKKSQKGRRPPEKKCLQASAENTPKEVDSSWKNAGFLFIFGPILYWRTFFHDTIHFMEVWAEIWKVRKYEKWAGTFLCFSYYAINISPKYLNKKM